MEGVGGAKGRGERGRGVGWEGQRGGVGGIGGIEERDGRGRGGGWEVRRCRKEGQGREGQRGEVGGAERGGGLGGAEREGDVTHTTLTTWHQSMTSYPLQLYTQCTSPSSSLLHTSTHKGTTHSPYNVALAEVLM